MLFPVDTAIELVQQLCEPFQGPQCPATKGVEQQVAQAQEQAVGVRVPGLDKGGLHV